MGLTLKKNKLSFKEYINFINNVVDMNFYTCIDETVEYVPEFYYGALHLEFAKAYCGYTDEDKTFEQAYNEYMFIDIDKYLAHKKIDTLQYKNMLDAINNKIEFKKQQILHSKKDTLSELLESGKDFINTMDEKFKNIDLSKMDGFGKILDEFKKFGISGVNNLSDKIKKVE